MAETDYCYSLDGITYYTDTDILEEIENDFEEGKPLKLEVGVKIPFDYSDFINGHEIIETMNEAAYEECAEHSEGYLDRFEDHMEVVKLEMHIEEYFKSLLGPIKFFGVRSLKDIQVIAGDTSFLKKDHENE